MQIVQANLDAGKPVDVMTVYTCEIDAVRLARDINDRRARIGTALAHPVVMGNGTLRLTTVPQD